MEIIQKNIQKKLPAFGPGLAQSINQEEMSDKSSEGPIRFDRVDNLCLKIRKLWRKILS